MSDSYEDAVAGVQSAPASSGGSEIVREKIIYPAAPAGVYRAMCVNAEEKEFRAYESDVMELKYSLRFELRTNILTGQPVTYKGTDGKDHTYSIWSKPLTRNFADGKKNGKPSNVFKLFKIMYGIPPPTTKRDEVRQFAGGIQKVMQIITFNHKLFEHAEVIINVGVKTLEDGRVVNTCEIEGFSCPPEMQRSNYMQLPPQVREKFPLTAVQTAMPNPPAASVTASSPSATAPSSAPSATPDMTPASAGEAAAIMGSSQPVPQSDGLEAERTRQAQVKTPF